MSSELDESFGRRLVTDTACPLGPALQTHTAASDVEVQSSNQKESSRQQRARHVGGFTWDERAMMRAVVIGFEFARI